MADRDEGAQEERVWGTSPAEFLLPGFVVSLI